MPFLKLTPKPPKTAAAPIAPRAVTKPKPVRSVKSLSGLTQEQIERALEKEYIDRGAVILVFMPTSIPNFKVSIDGRFALRLNEKLKFFQLFIFSQKRKVDDFLNMTYDDVKFMESTQLHFYYNEKIVTADMQIRRISEVIAKHLGSELEKIANSKREKWYREEDRIREQELAAANMREELTESLNSEERNAPTVSEEVKEKSELIQEILPIMDAPKSKSLIEALGICLDF